MIYEHLRGKSCLGLVRVSTDYQVEASLPDQEADVIAFAKTHNMIIVEMVRLEGITGSMPGARTDIESIIRRKRAKNDFDILLCYDVSRFSRAGGNHVGWLEFELNRVGIEVVFVKDDLPRGRHAQLLKQFVAYSSNEYAYKLSENSSRSSMKRIISGVNAYCARTPYAVDRLYVGPDGEPRYVIRALPGGTQAKLTYPSLTIIETFGAGKRNHYKKRGDERVVLIPGEERYVEAVRQMFQWKMIGGWGYMRIAQELTDQHVPTLSGAPWNKTVVKQVLKNPIYLGSGIANKVTLAVYNSRSADGPIPVDKETRGTDFYAKARLPLRKRDPSQWFTQEHPALADFLPSHLRTLAERWQGSLRKKDAARRADKHIDSPYLLKGLLTCAQGGHRMTGRCCGGGKYSKRYYGVNKGRNMPVKGSLLKRVIPAEETETAVLQEVRQILLDSDTLEEQVRQALEREADAARLEPGAQELQSEKKKLERKKQFIFDNFDQLGAEDAQQRLSAIKERMQELDRLLKTTAVTTRPTVEDLEENAKTLLKRLRRLGDRFNDLPQAALRQLLEVIVRKAVVDLETREVSVEIGVPLGLLRKQSGLRVALGLEKVLDLQTSLEAHAQNSLILGFLACRAAGKPMCVSCRRSAA